jgi:serine/threonine protein phosphatase PrpC
MALISDKGLRHHRNEDAGAIRATEAFSVLVVCDGVSTTANPDQASAAAAAAVADAVAAGLSGHEPAAEEAVSVLAGAVAAAQAAVCNAPPEEPGGYTQAPSTTLVAVVVIGDQLVTANVGDSRAYWIDAASPQACRQLSHDDSLAEAAIAAGASPEEAYGRKDAHTITHWLGTDAPEVTPHIEVLTAPGSGILLVCSDGLWNYYEAPEALRELVAAGPPGETALETARRLVDAALEAGGHDNITVAVKALGAAAEPSPAPAEASPAPAAEPASEAAVEPPIETVTNVSSDSNESEE